LSRAFDILLLCGLISTAQEEDDGLAGLLEVNAVTRSVGHSHLGYALSDRLSITGIAEAEALNTGSNFRLGFLIREA
jgi:hypothetical protein